MAGIAFGHAAGIAFGHAAAFGYACAFVLAVVLAQAAVLKALRPADTEAGFVALGVPGAPIFAWLVPAAEVIVAIALLSVPRIGGVAALVMLGAFSAVLARAIRTGVRAGCNCFGQTRGQPVSGVDLVRNALLAVLGAAALLAPRPVALPLTAASTLAALGMVAVGTAMLHWLRARQARRPQAEPAP